MKDAITEAGTSWCEITRVGVRFTGTPTFEELQQAYVTWQDINRLSSWAIGDLLNYAEQTYGETYAQLMDQTGLSYGRLANLKSISAAIPISRRRENVSISTHAAVAFLRDRPEEQDRLLDIAEESDMNRQQFRQYVKRYKLAENGHVQHDQGAVGLMPVTPVKTDQIVLLFTDVIDSYQELAERLKGNEAVEIYKKVQEWERRLDSILRVKDD